MSARGSNFINPPKSQTVGAAPPDAAPNRASASNRAGGGRAAWAVAALAAVATFIVFLPSLDNGFVNWDDNFTILDNPAFRGLGWSNIKWMFTTFYMGPYQPLSWMSLAVDYILWGLRPFGYHLTNVLLHAVSAGLLTLLAARLFGRPAAGRSGRAALLTGLFVALFWSLHPLRVEGVTWVTERREVLCGAFFLLTLLLAASGASRTRIALAALAAMLSKGTAVTLPVLLVLIELQRQRRGRPGGPRPEPIASEGSGSSSHRLEAGATTGLVGRAESGATAGSDAPSTIGVTSGVGANGESGLSQSILHAVRRHAMVFLLAVGFSIAAVFGQQESRATVSGKLVDWRERIDLYGYSLGFYVDKTVRPVGLAPLYEASTDLSGLRRPALWGYAGLSAALVAGWIMRRRTLALMLLAIAYAAMIAPVGGLIQVGSQLAADRYSYQPGIALALAAGLVMWRAMGALGGAWASAGLALAGIAVVCAPLATRCRTQQAVWRDSETLWRHQLAVEPETAIAHFNLAQHLIAERPGAKTDAEAEQHYRAAIAKLPHYADAWCGLAGVLRRSGRVDDAIEAYRRALEHHANFPVAVFGLGDALWARGRRGEALEQFQTLARIDARRPDSHIILSRALAAEERNADAVAALDRGLEKCPRSAALAEHYALILATHPSRTVRNGSKAVEMAERAIRLQGRPTLKLAETLAIAQASNGDFDRAVSLLKQVAEAAPPADSRRYYGLVERFERREPLLIAPTFP